ncbi:MAG TPA: trigger factor [Gaiellaceae bacterium]|nr:trigger factor [Gaiellaceae bacterium]
METQVEELPGNRVRLTVEVPRHDVEHAVEHAASDLAESLKIPGFRKGKVPRPVLFQRLGKERIFAEAVESHIGGWFWNAAARNRLRPVAQPDYDFQLPTSADEDWRFTATVDVQPKPQPADWTTLEVPRGEVEVPQELVDAELEALRHSVAELAPVEGRPAQSGDTVVLDMTSERGDVQRDYVAELGAGRLVEEIEAGVVGMSVGETKELPFELADGGSSTVAVTLKDVKEKVLPPLDDELARAASEFDTLDELRAEIHDRLRAHLEEDVEAQFRAAAADALVRASDVQAAGPLVEARTRELVNGLVRSVERRGIPFETYLSMTNTDPQALLERMRAEAAQSVGRELVLEAVADQLGIDVPDEEVEQLVREQTEDAGEDPDEVVAQLRHSGGFERLREDLRLRAALDRVAAEVKPIAPEVAEAREAIWTPDKEKPKAETKLWTPGSKEHA